jgi:hypothetical protein
MACLMVTNLIYSPLKTSSLFILLFIIHFNVFGQFVVTDSIKVSNIDKVSVDRQGSIYLGDDSGNVDKYNIQLILTDRFSPVQKGKIGILEAWNPLRVFVFYQQLQQYAFLDRFLVTANRYDIKEISSYVGLATVSLDNNLWLIDLAKFGLIKYNINYAQIEIERPFDLILNPNNYEITHIREYQNLLFVSDKKSGILIFDNLGNYLRTIKNEGISYFNFLGDKIYFKIDNRLIIKGLYDDTQSELKLEPEVDQVVIFKNSAFFLTKKWLKKANLSDY